MIEYTACGCGNILQAPFCLQCVNAECTDGSLEELRNVHPRHPREFVFIVDETRLQALRMFIAAASPLFMDMLTKYGGMGNF